MGSGAQHWKKQMASHHSRLIIQGALYIHFHAFQCFSSFEILEMWLYMTREIWYCCLSMHSQCVQYFDNTLLWHSGCKYWIWLYSTIIIQVYIHIVFLYTCIHSILAISHYGIIHPLTKVLYHLQLRSQLEVEQNFCNRVYMIYKAGNSN